MPKCNGIKSEWPVDQWRKAGSLALVFKKCGGEWNYKKVCFIFWFVLFCWENVKPLQITLGKREGQVTELTASLSPCQGNYF